MCGGSTGIRQIYFLLIVKPRLQAAIWDSPSGLENTPEVAFSFSAPVLGVGCFCRREVHNLWFSLHSMSGSGSNRFRTGLFIFSLLQGQEFSPLHGSMFSLYSFMTKSDYLGQCWEMPPNTEISITARDFQRVLLSRFSYVTFLFESWIWIMLCSKTPWHSCRHSVFW